MTAHWYVRALQAAETLNESDFSMSRYEDQLTAAIAELLPGVGAWVFRNKEYTLVWHAGPSLPQVAGALNMDLIQGADGDAMLIVPDDTWHPPMEVRRTLTVAQIFTAIVQHEHMLRSYEGDGLGAVATACANLDPGELDPALIALWASVIGEQHDTRLVVQTSSAWRSWEWTLNRHRDRIAALHAAALAQ